MSTVLAIAACVIGAFGVAYFSYRAYWSWRIRSVRSILKSYNEPFDSWELSHVLGWFHSTANATLRRMDDATYIGRARFGSGSMWRLESSVNRLERELGLTEESK